MIKRLQKYAHLGTPDFIFELVKCLESFKSKGVNCTFADLVPLFTNKKIDGISRIDGCISLAITINFITLKGDYLDFPASISALKNDKKKLSKKFIELLFDKMIQDIDFPSIFSPQFLSFDAVVKAYKIKNSAFRFEHSKLRQLLVDFGFLIQHPLTQDRGYIINSEYKYLLNTSNLPKFEQKQHTLTPDQFKESIEQKNIYGLEAEKFVLDYEKLRLDKTKKIEWVAEVIVNAGYDIASFNNVKDSDCNRFIEVKSYSGPKQYFYWSLNELNVAKRKREKYWLYLVNRDKKNESDYIPAMIQNPYEGIFQSNQWKKECQSWYLKEV